MQTSPVSQVGRITGPSDDWAVGSVERLGVSVVNLGCRVNRVESDWIETEFGQLGCCLVPEEDADLIVINTCAVTGEAQAKTRKAVRHALALSRCGLVVATGCAANLFPEELLAISSRVRVLSKGEGFASRALAEMRDAVLTASPSGATDPAMRMPTTHLDRAKRGIKVQDGCDNRCTYCIVWKARGASRSVALDEVSSQVLHVLDEGALEIDLTGVNLADYRGDDGRGGIAGFETLVETVASLARGKAMVRASSMEPPVSEKAIRAMADNSDVICPHLHLPLQAGCDRTLERMGRPYTTRQFADFIEFARSELPGLSVTTDVIVGFPGETVDDFEKTLEFCERMGFSKMHVFRYSPRPGTPAAELSQLDPKVVQLRSERLRGLGEELRRKDALGRVGRVERVLVERLTDGGVATGTTESYLPVQLDFTSNPYGQPGESRRHGLVLARIEGYDEATGRLRASCERAMLDS